MDQNKIYKELRAIYEVAKAMPPSKAMRMVQLAKSDEERKFFAYIADMNLQRTQKEVIKKGLF